MMSTKEDFMKKISQHSSFEEFKSFILSNPTILTNVVTGNYVFMHVFVIAKEFTAEKMLFLLEQNADIDKANIHGKSIMGILIQEIDSCDAKKETLQYLSSNLSVLIDLGKENENLYLSIASNVNLLKDISHLIEKYEDCQMLVDILKSLLEYPMFDLSSIFYPTNRENGVFSFTNSEMLLEIFIVKGLDSLRKEEDKLPSIMAMIRECIYCQTANELKRKNPDYLHKFFHLLFKTFENNGLSLNDLRNKYDMTLLMSLLVATTVTKQKILFEEEMEKFIEKILEGEYFEDKNINHKTNYKLAAQFDLSHIHGITKKSKAKNTVLEKDQLIPLKRVNRLNPKTGIYEKIPGPDNYPGQEKMLAKINVKMKGEDGKVCEKRPMITVNVNVPMDDDLVEDNVSVGIISDDEEELDVNDLKVNLISGLQSTKSKLAVFFN